MNESVRNSKQNYDESWCWCDNLNDWSSCKDHDMWNPSTCDYECNQACNMDKYLDIKSFSYKKRLIDK